MLCQICFLVCAYHGGCLLWETAAPAPSALWLNVMMIQVFAPLNLKRVARTMRGVDLCGYTWRWRGKPTVRAKGQIAFANLLHCRSFAESLNQL